MSEYEYSSSSQQQSPRPQPQPQAQPQPPMQQPAYYRPAPPPAPQPTPYQPVNVINVQQDRIPPEYQPLSPWAYFGYSLLFALPIAGFILLIVFSFAGGNINRRNYARSYFCWLIILAIIVGIIAIIAAATGASLFGWFSSSSSYRYR